MYLQSANKPNLFRVFKACKSGLILYLLKESGLQINNVPYCTNFLVSEAYICIQASFF